VDDSEFGKEDQRGFWKPNSLIRYPDVFVWPPNLLGVLRWVPNYLFPLGIAYALLALVVWTWLTPSIPRMQTLSADWILYIFARNVAFITLVVGGQHVWLYVKKAQGTSFKYNRKWPAPKAPGFAFGSQLKDNLFWTFCSGVPIWTAWEVLTLWLYSNGYIAGLVSTDNPIWFVALWFMVPLLHELHFFCIHRMIHWPPLYKRIHKIHHRNINPGPWSGLSMHPIEHLIYFSGFLIYWIVPAHPLHFMHLSLMAGLAPAQGHTGFDRIVIGKNSAVHLPYYAHYLHHRLFEVNYADGTIPFDKWFGSFHDGSAASDEALKARRRGGIR
jgi:sterol desaturase/sphingolipid hydroxylase (fatty acid hydroxylase superfamily)|tara:strand:+ start:671 stop:1654 length:984 start_codon:yes stop_codon:yes gene_type:complete